MPSIHTVVNALAVVSGMVCDGAKASCAAKIAAAVDAAECWATTCTYAGQQFYGGDGIVTKGVEATHPERGPPRQGRDEGDQ